MENKKCNRCKEIKPIENFCKTKSNNYGLSTWCKECRKEYYKIYYKNNLEKLNRNHAKYFKEYYKKNSEKVNEYQREWRKKNRDKCRKFNKKYNLKNKEYYKNYYYENKEKLILLNKKRRQDNKAKAIKYLGGRCVKCGIMYDGKNACIFQLHHKNSEDKRIKRKQKLITERALNYNTWSNIKKELGQCDLLCANCHFIEHSEYY